MEQNWICPNASCGRVYHHSAFEEEKPVCPVCDSQLRREKTVQV